MKKLLLVALCVTSVIQIHARGGSGAGWFFGGAVTGAALANASNSRDYNNLGDYTADLEAHVRDLEAENSELLSINKKLKLRIKKLTAMLESNPQKKNVRK